MFLNNDAKMPDWIPLSCYSGNRGRNFWENFCKEGEVVVRISKLEVLVRSCKLRTRLWVRSYTCLPIGMKLRTRLRGKEGGIPAPVIVTL